MASVLDLIRELAIFEKEPDAVEVTVEELQRDGFSGRVRFKVILAEENHEVLGMALFYDRYSTWKGKVIHLEDLIVKKAHRNKGVGTALYAEVMRHAHSNGYKRVSWEVLDWNQVAIDFYESTGAKVLQDWKVVQMDKAGLDAFVQGLSEKDRL